MLDRNTNGATEAPDGEWHPRLRPDNRTEKIVRGVMGRLLAYPWFDRLSLWGLTRYYFPLSRMWAAVAMAT